jgi:hypothetical protein
MEFYEIKTIVLFEETAMRMQSQRPLHVHGDAGHPSLQGCGQEKNNQEKWRSEEEEERHKGSPTKKKHIMRGIMPKPCVCIPKHTTYLPRILKST